MKKLTAIYELRFQSYDYKKPSTDNDQPSTKL